MFCHAIGAMPLPRRAYPCHAGVKWRKAMPVLLNEPLHEAVPLQNYPLHIPALPVPRAVPSRSAYALPNQAMPLISSAFFAITAL